jgi:hypothetical protein
VPLFDTFNVSSNVLPAPSPEAIAAEAIAMNYAAPGAVVVFKSCIQIAVVGFVFDGARDISDWCAIVINQASINFEL